MDDSSSTDLLSSTYAKWAIYTTGTSDQIIYPDSFIDIEFSAESRVSDYPMEQGAFASYNHVLVPVDIRVKIACAGIQMNRGVFIEQLEAMRESVWLWDISTPDALFPTYTMTHYDYTRSASNGVSLIIAALHFEQVRITGTATYSKPSDSPSANDPVNAGTVAAIPPTPAQQSAAPAAGPS